MMISALSGRAVFAMALMLAIRAVAVAAPQMLYVADPALNMVYGHRLDTDTSVSLVPISGSVTIVADSVVHLSEHEIAYVPSLERRVVVLDLPNRSMKTIAQADRSHAILVGAGADSNHFIWIEEGPGLTRCAEATRSTPNGNWEIEYHDLVAPADRLFGPSHVFTVGEGRIALLSNHTDLYIYPLSTGQPRLVNISDRSAIVRGPQNQILLFPEFGLNRTVVFDSEGNNLVYHPVVSAPLLRQYQRVVEWRADSPQLAGIERGRLLVSDTVDTTPTIAHTSRNDQGLVVPERDVSGAASLFRVAPDRWQFFNETGGLQVLNTTTHQVEYQLQYSAGSGPEFSAIEAMAMGPDDQLYILDSGQRLFRVNTATGRRELLKVFETDSYHQFIHVLADGAILLVKRSIGEGALVSWRLTTVRQQGAEWVASEGTEMEAPFDPLVVDFVASTGGVLALWRDAVDTHLVKLTNSGIGNVALPGTYFSGAPTITDFTKLNFVTEIPASETGSISLLRLNWRYSASDFQEYPAGSFGLLTPSGKTIAINSAQIAFRKFPSLPYVDARIAVELPEVEPAAGTWKLTLDTSRISGSPTVLASRFLSPITTSMNRFRRAQLMAPESNGAMRLLTRFPATLVTVGTGATVPLGEDPSLSRISSATLDTHGQLFLGSLDQFKLWRVNTATGAVTCIADERPAGLDGSPLGRGGSSFLQLAVGKAPESLPLTGWVLR